jgi:cytosine/adenosine deaminase-related metal-dependent hydrolase
VTSVTLRNARLLGSDALHDIAIGDGRVGSVAAQGELAKREREIDLGGLVLLPGLLNGHDHLDFSTFPALARRRYESLYDWADDVDAGEGDPAVRAALAVDLDDRLFLGGLRNLLAGVTAVAHHGPFHRSLARATFPVRVLSRYSFAHSPGLTRDLKKTYRTTDRRIPWMIHAAEGTDARCAAEIGLLAEKNLLRQNTVVVHAVAASAQDAARMADARTVVVWCPESNRGLYGATAPVAALRAAGVRVGLGSDSPVSGVRDALSNLAAARAEGVLADAELLRMATETTAEVARLPRGGPVAGAAADLIAVDSLEGLLSGQRASVALVLQGGRPLYADARLRAAFAQPPRTLSVDAAPRVVEASIGRRAAALLSRHRTLRERVKWLRDVSFT